MGLPRRLAGEHKSFKAQRTNTLMRVYLPLTARKYFPILFQVRLWLLSHSNPKSPANYFKKYWTHWKNLSRLSPIFYSCLNPKKAQNMKKKISIISSTGSPFSNAEIPASNFFSPSSSHIINYSSTFGANISMCFLGTLIKRMISAGASIPALQHITNSLETFCLPGGRQALSIEMILNSSFGGNFLSRRSLRSPCELGKPFFRCFFLCHFSCFQHVL